MSVPRNENSDLRAHYSLHLEIGLLLSLLVLIIAFQLDWSTDERFQVRMQTQEVVDVKEVQQTQQETEPPPPPKPPAPVEVPNNTVIEQEDVNFDASLHLDERLDPGQAPPAPDPEEEDEQPEEEEKIFVAVEEQPNCGGVKSLQEKIQYPEFARKAGIEGRVFVEFVVDEEGEVTNPTVTRGAHNLLDEEALRAVTMLECTPGKQRGQPVKVQMTLPVTFRVHEE